MNTLVLLGAGASAEAGIPMAREMTPVILNALERDLRTGKRVIDAIRFALSGLQFHQGRKALDTFAVDIEHVLNAVDLLAQRDELEVSAFVQWDQHLGTLERRYGLDLRPLADALERLITQRIDRGSRPFITHEFQDALGKVLEASHGSATGSGLFADARDALLRALIPVVWAGDPAKTTYLAPLFGDNDIATLVTLNYDNCLEVAAATAGRGCFTGIHQWLAGNTDFQAPSGEKLLLKLHGSANWLYQHHRKNGGDFESVGDPTDSSYSGRLPVVLFGERVKLTAQGPFLDLLMAFRARLALAKRVVVIGYSFRDEHVNEFLRRWADDKAGIEVIDIVTPRIPTLIRGTSTVQKASAWISGLPT